jgi:hypothetical protein
MQQTADVSSEAETTGTHALAVRDTATALNSAMEELRHVLIRIVRTSTDEIERRHGKRCPVDLACKITLASGAVHVGRGIDLSEAGVAVRDVPAMPAGTVGSLEFDGMAERLPFAVQGVEEGVLHIGFTFDNAAADRFRRMRKQVALRRAA